MKYLIFIDEESGEIFYYVPDKDSPDAVLIEPRRESEEDEELTH